MPKDLTRAKSIIDHIIPPNDVTGAIIQIRFSRDDEQTFCFGALTNLNGAENAPIPIYSIAKTILSIITLKMHEEGVLNIDQALAKYLSLELPEWARKLSLRSILAHRSGLADYGPLRTYHESVKAAPGVAKKPDEFFSEVIRTGMQFEQGAGFSYSNVGYTFIRNIIEEQSGKTLSELFDQYIASKVNLKDTNYLSGVSDQMITGYSPYLGPSAPDIRAYYDFSWVFHGTFVSSVSDLTSLFANLDQLVSSKSYEDMTALHRLEFPHPYLRPSYGLGLMGDTDSKFGSIYGHNGEGPGFSVAAYALREKNISIAAVVNRDSMISAEKLVFEFLNETELASAL